MVLHKLIGFDHLIVAVSLKICYRLFIIWHFDFRLVLVLWYRIVRYRWNPLTWINLGVLGIIHKRFVELRLDFSAFIRTDQILTSPSLIDIPPVFVFLQSLRQALLILVLWYRKWPPSVSLVPTAISYAGCVMLYNEE